MIETLICNINTANNVIITLLYTEVSKVKLATVVEADHKAPFSIATTQRC